MLLFLDIDGVMVPASSWRKPTILEDGFPEFSLMATNSLKKIISFTSADIVLTTSHKFKYSLSEWHSIFKKRNINIRKITRLPENTNYLNRKEELLNWFGSKNINDDFLIIDDDKSLNGLPSFLKAKLIQTSATVGLTDFIANEALKIVENSKNKVA